MSLEETCAVCGRTILAGEQVHGFTAAGGRRGVCELCVSRAEQLGWRREGEGEEATPPVADKGRRQGIGDVWRRWLGRARDEERPEAAPSPATTSKPDPAAPGMRSERSPLEPSPLSPFERAASRFNASEAGRTVAGLVRTLGTPWASVGASAGVPNEVRITVAWELSWYQWGVDLSDELRPVFQLDKGNELDQLDSAARQWNASVAEGGRIVLAAAVQGPAIGTPTIRR